VNRRGRTGALRGSGWVHLEHGTKTITDHVDLEVAVTAALVSLLLWGDLRPWLREFVLIGLGSGIVIVGAELARDASVGGSPKSQGPDETVHWSRGAHRVCRWTRRRGVLWSRRVV